MAVSPEFPPNRARWIAKAFPLLVVVVVACRLRYDPMEVNGSEVNDAASIGSGGNAGDATAGANVSAGGSGASVGGGQLGGAGASANGGASGGSGGAAGAGGSAGCTAGVGCTCESFGSHAYWFCKTPTGRADALAVCVSGGLSLVRIDDDGENTWLLDTATSLGMISSTLVPSDLLFTGANDIAQEGNWQWADGVQYWSGGPSGSAVGGLYANWMPMDPQTSTNRRCAGIFFTGKWQARSCTALQPYVCEGAP
jgi:hypothetical protein